MTPVPFLSKPDALFSPDQTPILKHLYYKGSTPLSLVLCILMAISGIIVAGMTIIAIVYTVRNWEIVPKEKRTTGTVLSAERQNLRAPSD